MRVPTNSHQLPPLPPAATNSHQLPPAPTSSQELARSSTKCHTSALLPRSTLDPKPDPNPESNPIPRDPAWASRGILNPIPQDRAWISCSIPRNLVGSYGGFPRYSSRVNSDGILRHPTRSQVESHRILRHATISHFWGSPRGTPRYSAEARGITYMDFQQETAQKLDVRLCGLNSVNRALASSATHESLIKQEAVRYICTVRIGLCFSPEETKTGRRHAGISMSLPQVYLFAA